MGRLYFLDSNTSLVRPQFSRGFAFLLLCFLGIHGNCSSAFAADQVTFSWRANPQSDSVMGYRLYFGSTSRFEKRGLVKQDFPYTFYLDFTSSRRCQLTDSVPACETYTNAEVDCEGIYSETPSCTLHYLKGQYYFAMTAYNAQAESDYSRELSGDFYFSDEPDSDGSNSGEPNSDEPDSDGSNSDEPDSEGLVFSTDGHPGGSLLTSEAMACLQSVYMLLGM